MAGQEPLYAQVRATLVERLTARVWRPGQALPSEMALAQELGVSQGTVRKAIDTLCADGALLRRQGSGTFVAEQTPETATARFFPLVDADGVQIVPELKRQIATVEAADAEAAQALALPDGTEVHLLERVSTVAGNPAILERICVPVALMPGLAAGGPLPQALYPHYQRHYGIQVIRTEESLDAVPADTRGAQHLRVRPGAPLLRARRRAFDLMGQVVEYRVAQLRSEGGRFRVELP